MNLKKSGLLRSKAPRNDEKKDVIASEAKQSRVLKFFRYIFVLVFLLTSSLHAGKDGLDQDNFDQNRQKFSMSASRFPPSSEQVET